MEDQKPDTSRNNNENTRGGFSPGTWGRKGKRRRNRPKFGLIRLGSVARHGLTSADFGVLPAILKGDEEDQ